jgi:hypothetical protein
MINRLLTAVAALALLAAGVPTLLLTPVHSGYAGPGAHLIVGALVVSAVAMLTVHFRIAFAHGEAAAVAVTCHHGPVAHGTDTPCPVFTARALDVL